MNTPRLSPVGQCFMPIALENWFVALEVVYKIFLNLEEARKTQILDVRRI